MDGTRRYELRLSLLWRAIFIAAGVMSFSMVADALDTGDAFTILTTLAFFGFGGFVMLKVILRSGGSIELRDDGLLIDSYLTTGLMRWEHFESAQQVRAFGVSYLGLSTRDPQAFIDSRKSLQGLRHEGDRVLAGGFMRIMMALLEVLPPARSGCSFVLSVFGFAPLPKKFDELSFMAWSRDSYGSQLLIHKMWLPEIDALLADLHSRATAAPPASVTRSASSTAADESRRTDLALTGVPEPNLKRCPMCAERVQPEARICRYCRYSFDEERLLPTSA